MTMQTKLTTTTVVIALALLLVSCRRADSPSISRASSPSPTALIDDLRKLAATHCGIDEQTIDVNAPVQKQGCDDLDLVELIMSIEEKYKVPIPDAEADGASINSLARIINRR